MIFFNLGYKDMKTNLALNLFSVRKKVFRDRLKWKVKTVGGLEFDEYDDIHTNYILGILKGDIVCGVRILSMTKKNMINNTFADSFNGFHLPLGKFVEASRFFVDKELALKYGLKEVGSLLCIAMINYSMENQIYGIYGVVNDSMPIIIRKYGWRVKIVKSDISKDGERIHILKFPVSNEARNDITSRLKLSSWRLKNLKNWPLKICTQ